MKIDQIRILNILEEISEHDHTSQRELSRKLNISLGLVNSFVKRLVKKGYFKITTISKNRFRYIITPKGAVEKNRLTYEYVRYSLGFYKETKDRLLATFQNFFDQEINRIVLFGTGELAELSFICLEQTQLNIIGVIDPNRSGQKFMGMTVMHPDKLSTLVFDKILITEFPEDKSIDQIADELETHQNKCALIR